MNFVRETASQRVRTLPRLVQRRDFLRFTAIASVAVSAPSTAAFAAPCRSADPVLDRGRWEPAARDRIQDVIRRRGLGSPGYAPAHPPYAVFDWDNTSIVNDTEEALLLYQIETFSFRISPDRFSAVIQSGVPAGVFPSVRNRAGQPVDRDALTEDLVDAYRKLIALPASARAASPLLADFRARLLFLYDAIDSSYGAHVAYPWVIYLLSGYTSEEVKQLAAQSNDRGLGSPLEEVRFTSSETQPGRSGVVEITHRRGLRVSDEIAVLMHTLRRNGFEVFVVSASLEDVVAAFATMPKYGYDLPRDHVFGLRLAEEDGRLAARYRKGWPLVHGPGKVELIRRELVPRFGRGPALVFGDSDGDVNMLTEFQDTEAGLIVNRLKGGDIGSLCRKAAASHRKPDARFLLQGRNDAIGLWQPEQSSRPLNSAESRLLA